MRGTILQIDRARRIAEQWGISWGSENFSTLLLENGSLSVVWRRDSDSRWWQGWIDKTGRLST